MVSAHSDWLYRYAYWLSGSKHEAEDLVQDTFLRAWRFLDSLKEASAAKAWLTTILRRENARRFERKRLEYSEVEIDTLHASNTELDTRPETMALRAALKQMPRKSLEPLILQVIGGFSMKEIARQFGIPVNTVATRLHRTKLKLKGLLTESDYSVETLRNIGT
jgi:RNA polymerase sigma-70 factor (ECF subfamily)